MDWRDSNYLVLWWYQIWRRTLQGNNLSYQQRCQLHDCLLVPVHQSFKRLFHQIWWHPWTGQERHQLQWLALCWLAFRGKYYFRKEIFHQFRWNNEKLVHRLRSAWHHSNEDWLNYNLYTYVRHCQPLLAKHRRRILYQWRKCKVHDRVKTRYRRFRVDHTFWAKDADRLYPCLYHQGYDWGH
jgi:hypothetical protein